MYSNFSQLNCKIVRYLVAAVAVAAVADTVAVVVIVAVIAVLFLLLTLPSLLLLLVILPGSDCYIAYICLRICVLRTLFLLLKCCK